ncbi:Autophagy-related protein 1 [Fusarium sp. Ph1]|nr:Autophagy-related protein 1 [Fusarium sp. Ph1]
MATLQGLPLQDLPELVRDSHLEATFHPNADIPNKTTHLKYQGRRRPQQEKWVRQKMLGRGGFGIVWLEKRDPDSPTAYNFRAVKQLDIAKIKSKRRDCVRELEALAKFSQAKYSEFFVKSYGWFQSPSALFLAMEYCELGDLKDHIEEHGKLAEDQVQDIGWQILQGLRFMHHNNFAHRDLKPANILIKNKPPHGDWHVKICDLGLSKRIGTDTATSTVQGTPGFMPPESVPGIGDSPKHIDPFPADMWCLGETIFYLLTRKQTFRGDPMQLRQYWKGSPFPKEPLLQVRASDAAISFVQELMARLPAQRLTAEMADQHELMKPKPFQEAEQETRETPEGREGSSTIIPEDPTSGRWTTGASHQQSLGVPSGSWGSIIVEEALPGQIASSPRNTELANKDTGPPSSENTIPPWNGLLYIAQENAPYKLEAPYSIGPSRIFTAFFYAVQENASAPWNGLVCIAQEHAP